ncbi:MAG: uracil-DNA glycosylase [Proteobacteria bacterium]|nr:uracil-DNA glycosylase [Pseudomonadota bacterium]
MNQTSSYYLDLMGIQRWKSRETLSSHWSLPGDSVLPNNLPLDGFSIDQLDWDDLRSKVAECTACDLCKTRKQTVFGVGSLQAKLMIVGEAPGFYEDAQGEPFVGKAGQLLNAMLQAIGLKREEVYIANVLKCRPPNNRDPAPEEVVKCTPFLKRQVALLKPKLIIALGRHAAHFLLDTHESLSKLRNKMYAYATTEVPLIVSYHPAYLLRNPIDKKHAYQDWQKVIELLQ